MLATAPKARQCEYAPCGRPFIPQKISQKVCGQVCAGRKAKADRIKAKDEEKASDRARKEKLKPRSELTAECRVIAQKIARIRDRHDGCISCHMGPNYDGQWHGSHFRPAGNHSAVELHLWNIHKSCAQCNLHKGGNIAGYRPRLIEKIGIQRVEWLESQNQVTKRPEAYLLRFKAVMGKRCRRLEKRAC